MDALQTYALYAGGAAALSWLGVFVLSCVLLAWANVPPVIHACGGFWEFMFASVLSPAIVPAAYALLGVGVVSWSDFRAVAFGTFAVASLVMCVAATTNAACVEAVRATSPPEPWLIILGWIKFALYGGVTLGAVRERCRPPPAPAAV